MLKLKPAATDLAWLDLLPGVRVQVKPISIADMLLTRDEVIKVYREDETEDTSALADIAITRTLGRRGIKAWEGVGDTAGEPAPVTPENIDLLLENFDAYDALHRLYVVPAMQRDQEKNVSSSAPGGTSEEAPPIAPPASEPAPNAST
ncbi:hypothetical protein [Methylobacterium sp. WL19]|uniref:hypothetical protein n=1 Tax=Methylobacterium sp. WL19 TaxID=2603896 RepID=UPI0011CC77A6|nr:hypothetical protein [Methylobacterium sp. WL19]TXN25182.1 hypothetical protein FV220_19645 [Methylobacterium sp. WL19]